MNSLPTQLEETSSANYKASNKDHKPHHKPRIPPNRLPLTENVFNPVCSSHLIPPRWSYWEQLILKKPTHSLTPKFYTTRSSPLNLTRDLSAPPSHNNSTSSNLVTAAVTRTWKNKSYKEICCSIFGLYQKSKSHRRASGTTWTRSRMMIGGS